MEEIKDATGRSAIGGSTLEEVRGWVSEYGEGSTELGGRMAKMSEKQEGIKI